MNNRPIGVFDSGVGGLSAVKEIKKIMPNEDIIYFGDTARVPYGNRSQQTIKKYARQAIEFLLGFDVKAIVAACGTVSTNFSNRDYEELKTDIPYFTVVQPAVLESINCTNNCKIGIMATSASIRSGAFEREVKKHLPQAQVVNQPCPMLVILAEDGITDKNHPVVKSVLNEYLADIIKQKADTVVLGCTHFPILKEAIGSVLGPDVKLIDSGSAAARALKSRLAETNMLSSKNGSSLKCYVTDTVEIFSSVAKSFLNEDISGNVYHIDVEVINK